MGSGEEEAIEETLWEPDEEDREILRDQEAVVPIIGAGFSIADHLPGADDLKQDIINNFNLSCGREVSLKEAADFYSERDPYKSEKLRNWVAGYFRDKLANLDHEPVLAPRLVKVPSKLIVTLNYDEILDQAALAIDPDTEILGPTNLELIKARTKAEEPPGDHLTILHLHGRVSDPPSIILDSVGYEEMIDHQLVEALFRELITQRRCCFIGTTLDELNLTPMLAKISHPKRPQMFFYDAQSDALPPDHPDVRNQLTRTAHGFRIKPINRPDVLGLVNHLARKAEDFVRSPTPESIQGEIKEKLVEKYVSIDLTIRSEDNSDVDDWTRLIAEGRRPSWSPSEPSIDFESERKLAEADRALVLGPPGSGKTELLRKTAEFVSGGRRPFLISLNKVQVRAFGDSGVLLSNWLESAGHNIDADALRNETFVFLLDGLDEVVPNNQEQAALRISEAAEAFPQHSFVVSSRPIPAATLLERRDWECREMLLGWRWRDRYLESREVGLSELIGASENEDELSELLLNPFFLKSAVDLYDPENPSSLGDAWTLVDGLVMEALSREATDSNQLPVGQEDARDWMKRVALAMRLAGTTTMQEEHLREFPVTESSADQGELITSLIQRSMLQDPSDEDRSVTFTHRIVGEFLAAEALLEMGPEPDVLDVVAPRLKSGRSGVASHWMVTVNLLISRSSEWRDAIRDRDRVLWATSVPSDAPLSERREAASEIWRTYCQWDTWISRRSRLSPSVRAGILQDGANLSRLLSTEGLSDIMNEIFDGLDDQSPRVQANAIEILSGPADSAVLAQMLRRMLLFTDLNSVVGRAIASAAQERGLEALVDPLANRATETFDEIESEACCRAALVLCPDDQLLDLSRRLAQDDLCGSVVLTRVVDRVGPDGTIEIFRVLIENGGADDLYQSDKNLVRFAIDAALQSQDSHFIASTVFVAASLEMSDADLLELIRKNKAAALPAIKEATHGSSRSDWWIAGPLIRDYSSTEIEQAGFEEMLVQQRKDAEYRAEHGNPVIARAEDELDPEPQGEEEETTFTLAKALEMDQPQCDINLQTNAQPFSREVEDLSPKQKELLRERLSEWIEEKSFSEAVTFSKREGGSSNYKIEWWANGWFWLAPILDMPLTPEQWAEFALMGVGYEEQQAWLKRQESKEAVLALAQVREGGDARDWNEALSSTTLPLPPTVIDAIVQDLLTFEAEPSFDTRSVLRRLKEQNAIEALKSLLDSPTLGDGAREHLAELGNEDALEVKYREMVDLVARGNALDRDHHEWIWGSVSVPESERWLPFLFDGLRLYCRNLALSEMKSSEPPVRARRNRVITSGSIDDTASTITDVIQAIAATSGERSREVASNPPADGYEVLLATGSREARWFRHRLHQVEETLFSNASAAAAPLLATKLDLPFLAD